MLFCYSADLIRDQMAEDLKENAHLPYSREWLERVYAALYSEIGKFRRTYPAIIRLLSLTRVFVVRSELNHDAIETGNSAGNVSALCEFFYRFFILIADF